MDEMFLGLNSTAWTAIGLIITGIGISTAHMIPLFQKRSLRKRVIKIIARELRNNFQLLSNGYKTLAFEFFPPDVYIRTNSYYSAITRFHKNWRCTVGSTKFPC